ncbi:MAG: type II toxin-antitoxin system VapC family toxin [Caldilineaceae bacterium]|nr:type II toxin-antitoxin system VapC family toxin [Caldilineaceae bacterium]
MAYLLDTDICIYLMNGRYPQVEDRLKQCSPDEVALSSIVVSELRYGAANSAHPARNHATLDVFLAAFEVLAYDYRAAHVYGDIRAHLQKTSQPIGSTDLFIAAHALAHQQILVTNNVREFGRVPNLQCENWVEML